MPAYRRTRRFGDNKTPVEFRVREAVGTGSAKAFFVSNGRPVLVAGEPVEMAGSNALNRAIAAVERALGKLIEPKTRKRKAAKKR